MAGFKMEAPFQRLLLRARPQTFCWTENAIFAEFLSHFIDAIVFFFLGPLISLFSSSLSWDFGASRTSSINIPSCCFIIASHLKYSPGGLGVLPFTFNAHKPCGKMK